MIIRLPGTLGAFRKEAQGRLLVPISLCAALAGVSRQRVYHLMDSGRVCKIVCMGWGFVDLSQPSDWLKGREKGETARTPA